MELCQIGCWGYRQVPVGPQRLLIGVAVFHAPPLVVFDFSAYPCTAVKAAEQFSQDQLRPGQCYMVYEQQLEADVRMPTI